MSFLGFVVSFLGFVVSFLVFVVSFVLVRKCNGFGICSVIFVVCSVIFGVCSVIFGVCSVIFVFISLTKPSQYCSEDFESFFYDNCLPKIAEYGNLEMPSKDTYLKTIHSNKVECLAPFKEKYNTDTAFNAFCKKIDKEGIAEFIRISEINRETLSNKSLTSQKGKQYMCIYIYIYK